MTILGPPLKRRVDLCSLGRFAGCAILMTLAVPDGIAIAQSAGVPHYIPRSLDETGAPIPWGKGGGTGNPGGPDGAGRAAGSAAASGPASQGQGQPARSEEGGAGPRIGVTPVPGLGNPVGGGVPGSPVFKPLGDDPPTSTEQAGKTAVGASSAEARAENGKGWEFFKTEAKTKVTGPKIGISGRVADFDLKVDPDKIIKDGASVSKGAGKVETSVGGSVATREFGQGTNKVSFGFGNAELSVAAAVKGPGKVSAEGGAKVSAFQVEGGNNRVKASVAVLQAETDASVKFDRKMGQASVEAGATAYIVKTTAEVSFPIGSYDIVLSGRVGYGAGAKVESEVDLSKRTAKYGADVGVGLLWGMGIGIKPSERKDKPEQVAPVQPPALPRPRRRRAGSGDRGPRRRRACADDDLRGCRPRAASRPLSSGGLDGRQDRGGSSGAE